MYKGNVFNMKEIKKYMINLNKNSTADTLPNRFLVGVICIFLNCNIGATLGDVSRMAPQCIIPPPLVKGHFHPDYEVNTHY